MSYKEQIDLNKIPTHIAVTMDGNGRWAKARGENRLVGHHEGVKSLSELTEAATEIGVKYLTVYAFSLENWNRPQDEINGLMALLVYSVEQYTEKLKKNNVRLLVIGNLTLLPEELRNTLQRCINETAHCTDLTLVLALSYSSRWEIINAVKDISKDIKNNELKIEDIDEKLFSSRLTTKNIPDPDLLIRTSGENRISNFLLWQLAYSELYFTKTYWPDFRKEEFFEAICSFQNRERRFGKTSEQVSK
jgi:undecaprenyl diphosphate synthase